MGKINFNPREDNGLELVRAIIFERLRKDTNWNQFDLTGEGFNPYVEFVGEVVEGRRRITALVQDVMWELIIQGVITPGRDTSNPNLPWFHLTEYGKKVLSAGEFLPHDPGGYLDKFRAVMGRVDPTVDTYLSESLNCFTRGCLVASVVMLGVASERVFLLICEAFKNAIENQKEKTDFERLLEIRSIKPKMDWIFKKVEELQRRTPKPFPDNVTIMLVSIFDFIRNQRNDLGHPRETPPKVSRDDAYVNLRIFPGYAKMGNLIVDFLVS
ncbi:MAG: hypothetical protein A2Y02_00010 [Omnitrophica bacterium GWA2_52_12]|nr:MAG: hypothetical protein A2Y02_00010 [Omnitrophica bacterium GWA2_52_12]